MKQVSFFFYLVLILTNTGFAQQNMSSDDKEQEWAIPVESRIHGLMTIWSEVKFGFPYPEKLQALNWDTKVLEYITRVMKAETEDNYYKTLMEFAVLLDDSHTGVLPPWGYFKPGFDTPPIEIQVINDKFYIARIGENEDTILYQLTPGTEILEVDKIPTQIYFKDQILNYYTQGSKQANEAVLIFYLLSGPANEKVHLKVRSPEGAESDIDLIRNSTCSDGSRFLYAFAYNAFLASKIEVKWFENSILYVNIPSFENDQIANDFQALVDTLDMSKIKGMILDVRYNMGGSDRNSQKIVECLINKSVSSPLMHYPQYIAAYKAWGREDRVWEVTKKMIEPRNGKKYLGPLAILTGPVTISSAEDMIIELKNAKRATTIGQRTAGGAGNTLIFDLPGGGTFKMATFKATFPDGTEYIGKGITPDFEVCPTVDDLVKSHDRALEKGIELFN